MSNNDKKPTLRVLSGELEPKAQAPDQGPPDQGPPGDDAQEANPFIDRADSPQRQRGEVFPGCMVQALGTSGGTFYYLNVLGELRDIKRHDKEAINSLFASNVNPLYSNFPRYKDGEITGWNAEEAREAMMRACAEKGVWNAFERVRGPGAWLDSDGSLILHAGNGVYRRGSWKITGEMDGFVYPAGPAIMRPAEMSNECQEAGAEALALFKTWNWQKPIAPELLLGWIVSAMFGGALKWRPMAWISGDAGMGKSTLQELVHDLLGGQGASLQASDATEASLRQLIGQATIPVLLDEQEASSNNVKVDSIVKLARQASSGGLILRGGADHKGQSFVARNCFLFSSILVPPLKDQDLSRIAVLNLLRLPKGATPLDLDPEKMRRMGARIRALVVDRWDRLRSGLALFSAQLAREGYSARAADQYGTLLAMADLVLHPDPATQERVEARVAALSNDIEAEQEEQTAGYEKMIGHLFQQPVNTIKGGSQVLVGELVTAAIAQVGVDDDDHAFPPDRAIKELKRIGLRVFGKGPMAQLAVANTHANLATYFEPTRWRDGVWKQDCDRIPGCVSTNPIGFGVGQSIRARRFPLSAIPHFLAEKTAREEPQATSAPHSDDHADFE